MNRFAILVNANAKRGGRRIAAQITRALPEVAVRRTKSEAEAIEWLRGLVQSPHPPDCFIAAGGDGTAMGLVNCLARVLPKDAKLPPIGVIPLGTGNAWANSVGAPKLARALEIIHRNPASPLPLRSFGLIDVGGTLAHFAGAGWDAQILNDYKDQLTASKGPPRVFAKSVYGYLTAMLFRTAPKTILFGRPNVIIENLGDEVWTMTSDGKLVKMDGVSHGAVLYDGLASVAGVATCPEYGYRFRAFPWAERFLGMLNVRIYDRSAIGAIGDIPKLWRGEHPLRGMRDWFTSAVRMTFSRPMPLEVGGDAIGVHRTVEYRLSERKADILDWKHLL